MLENAVQICDAKFGNLFLREGDVFRIGATYGAPPAYVDYLRSEQVFQLNPKVGLGLLVKTKEVYQLADAAAVPTLGEGLRQATINLAGARTLIGIPMLKDNEVIGAIIIYRQEVRTFTDKQIELVQNFAAQAVIAIENARLLGELRQRTDDLSEALEQQTAMADVLRVISSSPTDLAPVFDTILTNATRLCEGNFAALWQYDGAVLVGAAQHNVSPGFAELCRNTKLRLGAEGAVRKAALERRTIQVADITVEPGFSPIVLQHENARTVLAVPLLREQELVGVVGIWRREVQPFTEPQIALVRTFADQAAIAIENARLVNELRESLQQQTATSDVLKVISRSTFDLQNVLDTLVESAAQLCRAERTAIRIAREGLYHNLADFGFQPAHRERMRSMPLKPGPGSMVGRVVLEGHAIHMLDAQADPDIELALRSTQGDVRSMLGVPMMREGAPIGVLLLQRTAVQPFTEKQIELATTFADQAVIAIENVRLFDEVQARTDDLAESLQQQTATADVLKVISRSTFDLQPVFDTMAESAVRLCEAERAYIFRFDGKLLRAVASHNAGPENQDWVYRNPIPLGRHSVSARAGLERRTVQVADIQSDPEYSYVARDVDPIRTTLAVPMLKGDELIGTITIYRLEMKPFTAKQVALMETFADQAVIAIENVRLFDEIQDKSRQLAEASQHKSQFLANMSHELRTPLNAILGYNELIVDGIYGTPSEKMQAVLKRVESNGRHLLGLINAVLDLSKIEAGQFTLDLADYSLQNVAQTVYNAVEPLALDKKLVFKAEVQSDLPLGRGDERRLTQVLLNLVGNAIKFTDAGEVVIKADASDGTFNLAVRDTGPGISAADQAKLFQEFQQADNSMTRKKEGTGLGLAISKRIIEMHGGRIWIESQVGRGSTFFVTLPVQAQAQSAPTSN